MTSLRLANAQGASAVLNTFGARLVELRVPDREGTLDNVTLGFDDVADYRRHASLYFGATVGRVAGRIAGSAFTLDGRRFELTPNEGANQVHGGTERSFDRVEWQAEPVAGDHGSGIAFTYESPAGEEGYPGNLTVRAEYSLSDENELWTVFTASTDELTPVNMTNHAYWNLHGAGPEPVIDHELTIAAERVVAMDEDLIPTGRLDPVAGTALDFRAPRRLGERLPENATEPWPGFDTAFVLDPRAESDVAASLRDPASGRAMDIVTTEKAIQMYTANRLPDLNGRDSRPYKAGNAICLEPYGLPDALHRPEFPSVVLAPGQEYRHSTCYRFYVR